MEDNTFLSGKISLWNECGRVHSEKSAYCYQNNNFYSLQSGFPLKNMLSFVSLLERVEIHSFTFRESTIVHFQKVSNLNGVVLSVGR